MKVVKIKQVMVVRADGVEMRWWYSSVLKIIYQPVWLYTAAAANSISISNTYILVLILVYMLVDKSMIVWWRSYVLKTIYQPVYTELLMPTFYCLF